MSTDATHPTRGPRARRTAEALSRLSTTVSQARRRISAQDRRFVDLYVEGGCLDAVKAATDAGFKRPNLGHKLVKRLRELIDNERVRRGLIDQMELDEALRLVARLGRDESDGKIQLAALQTILRVHGALSDRPIGDTDRKGLMRQVEELVGKVHERVPGASIKVKAALQAEIDVPGSDPTKP